jgi:hypothetical protein
MKTSVKISSDLAGKSVDPSLYRSKGVFYISLPADLILFSVWEFGLIFKQILKNLTVLQSNISLGMLMILFYMAYGILGKQILLLQYTLMQTGLKMLMIGRAPLEVGSMWEIIL